MPVDMSSLIADLENLGLEAFAEGQQILGERMQEAAPVDTGELRDSIELTIAGGGTVITGSIAFTAPQAEWTNSGTRPHEITGNPTLAFDIGGVTVFATRVDHPGNQGSHWFDNLATDEEWAAAVQQALESLSI